jgi:hypothetical protein
MEWNTRDISTKDIDLMIKSSTFYMNEPSDFGERPLFRIGYKNNEDSYVLSELELEYAAEISIKLLESDTNMVCLDEYYNGILPERIYRVFSFSNGNIEWESNKYIDRIRTIWRFHSPNAKFHGIRGTKGLFSLKS